MEIDAQLQVNKQFEKEFNSILDSIGREPALRLRGDLLKLMDRITLYSGQYYKYDPRIELLKNENNLYSLKLTKGKHNIRIIFCFTINQTDYYFLTIFQEKNKHDYRLAIKRALFRKKILGLK